MAKLNPEKSRERIERWLKTAWRHTGRGDPSEASDWFYLAAAEELQLGRTREGFQLLLLAREYLAAEVLLLSCPEGMRMDLEEPLEKFLRDPDTSEYDIYGQGNLNRLRALCPSITD
jgi:hypothetical protein